MTTHPERFAFIVRDIPIPQGSKTVVPARGKRRATLRDANDKKLAPWRRKVTAEARNATRYIDTLTGPVRIWVNFTFAPVTTIKTDHEGDFADYTTRGLVGYLAELLNEGDVILGGGDIDYAAADMLKVLAVMHDDTGIDVELLPQVRAFCITVLDQAGWSE